MGRLQPGQAPLALSCQGQDLGAAVARIRGSGDHAQGHQRLHWLAEVGLAHAHRLAEVGGPAVRIGLQDQQDRIAQLADAGAGEPVGEGLEVALLGQSQPEAHRGVEFGGVQRRAGRLGCGVRRAFHGITYTI